MKGAGRTALETQFPGYVPPAPTALLKNSDYIFRRIQMPFYKVTLLQQP
jgi:hypothetical protein